MQISRRRGTKRNYSCPPHKTNRRLQLTALLLLLLFTALAAPSASRAAIAPVVPASDDRGVYLLSEPGHLLWFRDRVNAGSAEINAKLTKDIDLSEDGGKPSEWIPVGQYTDKTPDGYAGSFDGGGFTVGRLYRHRRGEHGRQRHPRRGILRPCGAKRRHPRSHRQRRRQL